MKFGEVNIHNIEMRGFDKMLVMRNGEMIIGGSTKNVIVYQEILKNKEIKAQYSDQDIWIVEVVD